MKRLLRIIIGFTPIMLLTSTLISCNNTPYRIEDLENGYKKLSILQGDFKFSFEYPSSYQKPAVHFVDDTGEIQVTIGKQSLGIEYFDIFIFIQTIIQHDTNAKYWLDSYLGLQSESLENFILQERNSFKMNSRDGEFAVYTSTDAKLDYTVVDTLDIDAAIVHDGYILNIGVSSDIAFSENATVVFEHVLNTFSFLD